MKNLVRSALLFTLCFVLLGFVIIACQSVPGAQTGGKPTVIIASPPSGSVYSLGEQVVVQSTATDPTGVTKVSLLVDGNDVRDDPSPVAQGQAQFSLIQSWVAAGVGQHTLTVRATNAQGATADSGIIVNVQQQGGQQPTAIVSIATAVPIATSAPQPTTLPGQPTSNPAITVVVTATPVPAVNTPEPTVPPPCANNSKFVADLTIPDGTIFVPGAVFTKSWRVQNIGSCTWQNYSLVFASGRQMAPGGLYPVPTTPPGGTADLSVPMTAPSNYGGYGSTWRLRDAAGNLFGTNLTVVINVPSPATPVPPTATPPPTNPPSACTGKPNDFTFTASSSSINSGQSVTISWGAVTNATAVHLDGGEFSDDGVSTPGNRTVSPTSTTTYTLTATCSNGGQSRSHTVTITLNAPIGNFGGQWFHNFGTMNLTQNGNTVTGTYTNSFDGGIGAVAGTVVGNVLTGTYQKASNGPIQFTLSNDGNSFTGNWGGSNSWCGARPGANFPNGCSFAGHWQTAYDPSLTQCTMDLTLHDSAVTGTYCNGTIDGTVSYAGGQAVLNGTWHFGNLNSGPYSFYLFGYNALQFNGNYNTSIQWCGWRTSSSQPATCKKP